MSYRKPIYLILFILIVGGIILIPQTLIKVQKVECESQFGECSYETAKKLDSIKGKSLLDSKKEAINVLKNESLVSDFSVHFKLPSTLEIDLLIKKARFAIADSESKNIELVTGEGEVVGITENTSLPKVVKTGNLKNVGEKVSEEDFFTLQIIDTLFYLYQIKEGKIKEGGFQVPFPQGFLVIFPLTGDKDRTLGALRFILSGLNQTSKDSRMKNISLVDLRFKNPVIR